MLLMEFFEGWDELVSGELALADIVEEDLQGASDSAQKLIVF